MNKLTEFKPTEDQIENLKIHFEEVLETFKNHTYDSFCENEDFGEYQIKWDFLASGLKVKLHMRGYGERTNNV